MLFRLLLCFKTFFIYYFFRLTLDINQITSDSQPREPKKAKVKKKNKSNKSSLDQRFQTFTPSDMAPKLPDTVIHNEEKKLRYCEDEGTLPDLALVHGRLLVQAWEEGRMKSFKK